MRKIITIGGALLSIFVCIWITYQSKEVGAEAKTINWVFLVLMILLISVAWLGGLRKMAGITRGLRNGLRRLTEMEKSGLNDLKSLNFDQQYLDDRYKEYIRYIQGHGETDIREFINEYDIGTYVSKKFLEIVPDILTSAGILGTFIGLVVGLREFDPSGYQQMSASMIPLIDGIKVAFLTSIYGIAISLAYSFFLSNVTENMDGMLEEFLEKYYFMDKKKKEPFGELLAGQKEQTEILLELTETFTTQLADRFEKIITPTFIKLGEEIDQMADNQKAIMREAADEFAEQFQKMFLKGMSEFEENLKKIGTLQTEYIHCLDTSVEKMNLSVKAEQDSLKKTVQEINRYFRKSAGVLEENIEKQRQAVDDYTQTSKEMGKNMIDCGEMLKSQTAVLQKNIQESLRMFQEYIGMLGDASREIGEAAKGTREVVQSVGKVSQGVGEESRSVLEAARGIQSSAGEIHIYSGKIQEAMNAVCLAASDITKEAEKFAEVLSRIQATGEPHRSNEVQIMSVAESGENEQTKLLEEVLDEMKELVELEKKRQNRGLWNRIFRSKR